MRRRSFLGNVLGTLMGFGGVSVSLAELRTVVEMQRHWRRLLAPGAGVADDSSTLELPEPEWKRRLMPAEFAVLRLEETERPYSSALNDETRPGVYVCGGCRLPVFTSEMKFDAGTGWPSFFTSIPGSFVKRRELHFLLLRTEYHCARCGGHHGHVFADGPEPTRERWCNNGAALRFIAMDS